MDEEASIEKLMNEMLIDKYGSTDVSEICDSPQYREEFDRWVELMEAEYG